ncbi:MAG: SMR family transporter [Rhizobiaceae bacterium]
MNWLFLAIAIVLEVIGTTMLKQSEGFSRLWPSLGSLASYGAAFWFLSLTLKSFPVGIVYGIWSGAGIVLTAAIGWLWFGQILDWAAFAGMGLIIAGVGIISAFSSSLPH